MGCGFVAGLGGLRAAAQNQLSGGLCPAGVVPQQAQHPRRRALSAAWSMTSAQGASDARPVGVILMGSASDLGHCQKIAKALEALNMDAELRIASAHKVPATLLDVIDKYEADQRPKVYISVAGRSNALSGMLDCAVSAPVIACPPYSDAFAGGDVFSSIRMPGGVAPALVLDPAGAALMAAKIIGVSHPQVRQAVADLQKANRDRLSVDDKELTTKTYLPTIRQTAESAEGCVTETNFLESFASAKRSGKVRDQYELGDKLVLITTDRQSAFDRVLAEIPYKGQVLNKASAWWFSATKHIIPNHVLSIPHPNVTIARKCSPFPVEFVVRGYITGSTSTSLWKNYSSGVRNYCGIDFPDGLRKNQKLAFNVLTPTTKDDLGDRPISPEEIVSTGLMSQSDFDTCHKAAMEVFAFGQSVAAERGLILVDTKYEFGRDEKTGEICLIDEVHTPDSSRFWLSTSYASRIAEGKEPQNVDKEILRLWFADNCDPYNDKDLPEAPIDLVEELSRRYIMLYELITGENFDFSQSASGMEISVKRALGL